MKTTLSFFLFLIATAAHTQYYYNDIMGTSEINNRFKIYLDNNVKAVTVTGYDPQGVKTSDFNEWQEIDATNNTLRITTRNGMQETRLLYRFDPQQRLTAITDSSTDIKNTTTYRYDHNGNLAAIKIVTEDAAQGFNNSEEHQWWYNAQNKPEKMLRIRNNTDTLEYRFAIDEKGNVADEQLFRRGVGLDPIYYYYNDNNLLTDIVRYNKKAKRLLPDFMFEYDDKGRVIQKITIVSTTQSDYLIWRYLFNEKGLKTKEALYNKARELKGRMDYAYTFNP
jgi:hypothetical protein